MKILEYSGLDVSRVDAAYSRICAAIARDDFHAAQAKKLVGYRRYYRARLDDSNRLLFTLLRYDDQVAALMLEVIANHAYEQSRFLRGAQVDEDKIVTLDVATAAGEAETLRYLHPQHTEVHLLDKFISFDDAQAHIYHLAPPLIIVGSAGSGKTALTLEKLKHAEGEVLYITHSAYLAQSARDLYFSHGFEKAGQDASFLSYREFIESLRVPTGREAGWRDFAAWFGRQQQAFRGIDGHQAFEEIRGVIAADAGGVLSREAYRALGVRQSIFDTAARDRLYDLFEKYCAWLAEARLFDLNLAAHERMALAAPRYDFVLVDEAQDLTSVQLALVLRTLRKPGHFLLCGDSNQIVHPNFFSWSQVKTLFWRDASLAARQELQVLRANFRNSQEATRVANTLLKIKHCRFGSTDRESNFLVQALAGAAGSVSVLADKEASLRELDKETRQSTRFAVLVMREEDKAGARRHFQTPLVFSIQEAKGLEYENIVVYRFISDHRAEYAEIVAGVCAADLVSDELDYGRARDKHDKSLEIYKFYVNALYVALTRATNTIYLIESDTRHDLLRLLDVHENGARIEAHTSSREDWQKEARKLELQGKDEQAQAIRSKLLKEAPVPWPIFDETRLRDTLVKVFHEHAPGNKQKQQLFEYAACYTEPVLMYWLREEAKFNNGTDFEKVHTTLGHKHFAAYYNRNFKDILRQCAQYGIEHRTAMNQTPLMAAAAAGNVALVEALLELGADPEATDHLGRNALHWALLEAFLDPKFAQGPFAALYERIAPAAIDVMVAERLVRIDRHLTEYLLFQTLWALFKSRFFPRCDKDRMAFSSSFLETTLAHLPSSVLRSERKKRTHISAVLSRNEVERDYAYNRALFKRVEHGWYQFNPQLAIRRHSHEGNVWQPVLIALNLPLIHELAWPGQFAAIRNYLAAAGLPEPAIPVAAERSVAQEEREEREEQAAREAQHTEEAGRSEHKAGSTSPSSPARTSDTPIETRRLLRGIQTRKKDDK